MASPTFSYCTCNDSDVKPHVHCQCEICYNAPVSRATAYRHFNRNLLLTQAATQADAGSGGNDNFLHDAASSACSSPNNACVVGDQEIDECVTFGAPVCSSPTASLSENCLVENDACSLSDQENNKCDYSAEADNGSEGEDILCESPMHMHLPTDGNQCLPNSQAETVAMASNTEDDSISERIVEAVLDALELQLELKLSQVGLEKILDWGKKLFLLAHPDMENLWPKNWSECEKVLKKVGYEDAKQYFICLDDSHCCLYGLMESSSQLCPHCGKQGTIPYYYIGLNSKLKLWCKDPEMCRKMTYHMKEKDHWFYENTSEDWGWEMKKEFWDGKRFSQLSWFWNPDDSWTLPVFCPDKKCRFVIPAANVEEEPFLPDSRLKKLMCPSCHKSFEHEPVEAHGDPRNIAYILHWDGFQPFSGKENHGCGALEVQIATMCKEDRCKAEEVFVVGFVPCYLLPHKRPAALDPFLAPFIQEIETGFIEGVEVNYSLDTPWGEAGPATLRHLVLLYTADYPAMCELCKSKFCGKSPCRRCECGCKRASEEATTYYYGDYRRAARFPWPRRLIEEDILQEIEEEERATVASTRSQEVGFTGLSILYRLTRLYGFDIQRDCIIDVMHTVSLGIIKHHFRYILNDDAIDRNALQERLRKFPWSSDLRASRYPSNINRTGFWKAEDYQKFAFPASELVLGGIINDQDYEVWETLPRIVEFLYYQGRNGWNVNSAIVFKDMCFRYNILLEERYGLSSCHLVNHLLTHIHEDVMNFGSPDNYWCYDFERAVARYISISNNHKNIELTFARAELRREILKVRESINSKSNEDLSTGSLLTHYCASLSEMSSIVASIPVERRHHLLPEFFTVGPLKGVHWNDRAQRNEVLQLLHEEKGITAAGDDLSDVACECRSICFTQQCGNSWKTFKAGDSVITESSKNGFEVLTITQILRIKVHEEYQVIIIGDAFQYVMSENQLARHSWSKYLVVEVSGTERICHASNIKRHVILCEDALNLTCPGNLVCVDFTRPDFPITSVTVPSWPMEGDMVLVKGDGVEPWRALVQTVSARTRTIKAIFYVPHSRWGRESSLWVREGSVPQNISWKSILGICKGSWRGQGTGVFREEE